jgi:hypothetical protein
MKYFLFCILFLPIISQAAAINGQVTDEKKQPLPYATVFLKNTSIGTTSNSDGYYSFDAPVGDYEIVFQYVGYRKYSEKISIGNETITLNISLKPESFELKEVIVDGNTEDPAYNIIRQAQKKRKFYLDQVRAYSCNVYIKGVQGLDQIPTRVFGIKAKKLDVDSSALGIVYLSESESQYNHEEPDKVKEIIYSSKVSGDNSAFSWNSASAFSSDFYENLIPLQGIVPRGLVSPIAEGAFTFYKYHLLGTFFDEGLLVNKIQVIPKRSTDPVFSGTIYIVEDQWRIHSLNLLVTKEAHLDFLDSLRFMETYGKVNDTAWMPFNQLLQFNISVLGFKGAGRFVGIFSRYNLAPGFSKDFFDAERLKVNSDANKKDSVYWQEHRPVPLTTSEKTDYHRKDSLHTVQNSKKYLDSVDRKENRFHPQDLVLGYHYQNSFHHLDYEWRNPLLGVSYNTVEGLNLTLRNTLRKDFPDQSRGWRLNAEVRYGFSNQRIGAKASFMYHHNPVHHQQWLFVGGIFPTQINEDEPISELVNAGYSLIAHENFMKLYEKRFVTVQHRREWFNGFELTTSVSYSDRLPLENTNDYSIDWIGKYEYVPNNFFGNVHADTFFRSQALILDLKADITIGQHYITRPNGRFRTGSKFPTFTIEYRKGIQAFSSDVNFDMAELSISHELNLGLVGRANISVAAGSFISHHSMSFIDFKHFQGNQTIIGEHYQNGFQLLPYYAYSTNESWLEGHYEHHFGGFIFNKIPLIKKLNLQEVGGAHLLLNNDIRYIELDAGIEHLFKILRIDFVTSFGNHGKLDAGFLIGLNLNGAFQIQ